MKYTLVLTGRLAGLNDYVNACRANRYEGANMKKAEQFRVVVAICSQLPSRLKSPIRLSFRWYEPNQKRDLDNVCFAKKFILDALVESHRILNDGWNDIKGFDDSFFTDNQNPRVEVDIEEV